MMYEKDTEFPLKTYHEIMFARERYIHIFESRIGDSTLPATDLTPEEERGLPWMIEAPLCSVEIIEALLKPSQPFKVHTARHIHRGCVKTATWPSQKSHGLRRDKRLYQEFQRFQGRLEKDREIAYVSIPMSVYDLEDAFGPAFWPVQLTWISIPWSYTKKGLKYLTHPWGLVLYHTPNPSFVRSSYEARLRALLKKLGISGCDFRRSLLKPGTTPLPECLWDWIEGIPGSTAALLYYMTDVEARDVATDDENAGDTSKDSMTTETPPQDGAHTAVAPRALPIRAKAGNGRGSRLLGRRKRNTEKNRAKM